MTPPAVVTETCAAFTQTGPLDPNAIHRLVVGEDTSARTMSHAEATAELGDPFATILLLRGVFPHSGAQVMTEIDRATGTDDPLRAQKSFILGEGSQILSSSETDGLDRGFRFVVARGIGDDGPDLLVSTFDPDRSFVELMAWDRKRGGFNFYRSVGDNNAWVWAGNSRHALSPPTRGKGPFESHPSGNLLMKELKFPWINWHSPAAKISPEAFSDTDPRRRHPWFLNKHGANVMETDVARPAIQRWTKVRLASVVAGDGQVEQPSRIMEQILGTPTVNLISSQTESAAAAGSPAVDLPATFFIDADGLTAPPLSLQAAPSFSVAGSVYGRSLTTFDFKLVGNGGFVRHGDSHFAFVVPERSFEDQEVLRQAIGIGLVSQRLAACLLMTDFPNPVFSPRRASLLRHVPPTATIKNGTSTFSEEMAAAILAAATGTPDGSPEREFADGWGSGDGWRDRFNGLLASYYAAVTARLATQEGFDDYVRLAEARRNRVRAMPIFENTLLFPETNIPPGERSARPDGTVVQA